MKWNKNLPAFNFAFARYKLIENLKLKIENYFKKEGENCKIYPGIPLFFRAL